VSQANKTSLYLISSGNEHRGGLLQAKSLKQATEKYNVDAYACDSFSLLATRNPFRLQVIYFARSDATINWNMNRNNFPFPLSFLSLLFVEKATVGWAVLTTWATQDKQHSLVTLK
jgi:hypothetical protein